MKHSASRGDLSTEYSRKLLNTVKNFNRGENTIEISKSLARESINHLNSPDKSTISSALKMQDVAVHEVGDESTINFNRGFMDQYYASNGYFCFSQTRKDMREKDAVYDRLQSFVDERLLEIASQISVKHEAEENKNKNIDRLTHLKDDIEILIEENESILEIKQAEMDVNRQLTQETEALKERINEIK
jgi:hypothetical protein